MAISINKGKGTGSTKRVIILAMLFYWLPVVMGIVGIGGSPNYHGVGACLQIAMAAEPVLTNSVTTNSTGTKPLSLSVTNAPLKDVILGISRSHKLDIMGVDSLEGTVTATVQGRDAIDIIEQLSVLKGFSITSDKGLMIVEGHGKDSDYREAVVITPRYVPPESMKKALSSIVGDGNMSILKERNQLLIYCTPKEQKQIQMILSKLDQEPKQVALEATIIAMEHSYAKETGFKWSWLGLTGTEKIANYRAINFGKAINGEAYHFFVKPELQAMESSGKAVLIARPSIMTLNGEEAKILIGDRIPVVEESSIDGETKRSVNYKEVGIRLVYTPYISDDGTVDAFINAEVSSPVLVPEMKVYKIVTREAKTRVRLKQGEVLVIGGLMDNRDQRQYQKTPLLGDIPLLGKLFRHSRKTKDSVEMMILVKASVV